MIDKIPDVKTINQFIKDTIKSKAGIDNCTLEMEEERYLRGFVHKMKTYILVAEPSKKEEVIHLLKLGEKDEGKPVKVIVHGAYFKSSKASKVYDDAIQLVIKWICDDTIQPADMFKQAIDIQNRPIEDFVMRVRMSKDRIDEYGDSDGRYVADHNLEEEFNPIIMEGIYTDDMGSESTYVVDLAKQMQQLTGAIPDKRTPIEYLMTKNAMTGRKNFEVYNRKDELQIHRIDHSEYIKSIAKMFEETGIYTARHSMQEDNMLDIFEAL